MKSLLWLGVLFLSASWLFYIPQFNTPDVFIGTVFLVLGVLCMTGGIQGLSREHVDLKYLLLLIAFIPALLLIPFPYTLGLVMLTIGLVLSLVLYTKKQFQPLPYGLMFSGLILLFQTLVFPVYIIFVSHGHRLDVLSWIVSPAANLLGLHTSVNHGILFVETLQQNYPITITWEKLGFYLLFNIFLGALVLFWVSYDKRKLLKYTLIFLLTGFLYIIVRFIAVLSFYLITTDLSIFWNPYYMILSYLPFILLLFKLIPLKDIPKYTLQVPLLNISKKQIAALGLIFLMVFSGV